jgi:hypothetical protein
VKPFRVSIQISLVINPGVLGVLVWSDDKAAYFPAAGEQDRGGSINAAIASCATSGRPLAELIDYYMETGGGGYLSFSEPEVVEADTLADAAAAIARRAGIALVLSAPPKPAPSPARASAKSDLLGVPASSAFEHDIAPAAPPPAHPPQASATSHRAVRPRHDPCRRIRLARAVIEVLAPDVSVAFFVWTKEPGNNYLSFYPTSMLPARGSPRWTDSEVAHRIFYAAVDPMADPPRPLTIGQYDATVSFPGWATKNKVPSIWPPPKSTRGLPWLSRGLTTRLTAGERAAVRSIVSTLDVVWLRRHGSADPATTAVVLAWIDAIVEAVTATSRSGVRMSFEQTASPDALLWAEVVAAGGDARRVGWPGW